MDATGPENSSRAEHQRLRCPQSRPCSGTTFVRKAPVSETATSAQKTRMTRSQVWLLTVACAAVAAVIAAMASLNTALPDIAVETGATQAQLTWIVDGYTLALAALLLVPTELGLNPHSTDMLFVYAFTVAVVGGLDSPVGALLGGLAVGILITLVTGFLGSTVAPIAVLALLVCVLLVRPGGIFSTGKVRVA